MDFQRARNKEQFELRETDIVNAAMVIYEEFGFEGVTFSRISEKTKFTRPTIYSYFKTKEEIMLRLIIIYLEKFITCFNKKLSTAKVKDNEFVANSLTECFIEVGEFIHLYTVLYSIIEKNVSLEALVHYKKNAAACFSQLINLMKSVYTSSTEEELGEFLIFCLCYASGICPMSEESELQKEAIMLSETGYVTPNFEKLFNNTLLIYLDKLTLNLQK